MRWILCVCIRFSFTNRFEDILFILTLIDIRLFNRFARMVQIYQDEKKGTSSIIDHCCVISKSSDVIGVCTIFFFGLTFSYFA